MKLIEAEDYADLSHRAAAIVLAQLSAKPASTIVLPTGNTPVGMFRSLVAAGARGEADFGAVRIVTLDEYAGIGASDRRRLLSWLRRELLAPLAIPDHALIAFDPTADPAAESARMEAAIAAAGGVDLAVLGLGPNGHLGMNEPGSAFDSRTRLVTLTPESISSNSVYWGSESDVPRSGLTLGLGTLADARSVLLLVSGAGKAAILERTLSVAPSPSLPATVLRSHPHCTVIADRAARSALARG